MSELISKESKKESILFIHVARCVACVAVVAIHCVSVLPISVNNGLLLSWWTSNIVISFSIWAVPLFVMLSGALLLDKDEPAHSFYSKRFQRIGLATCFWIPFYFVFYHFYRGDSLAINAIAVKILHSTFDHLYFLVLILELYFITPLLRKALRNLSMETFLFLTLLFFYIGIFWPRSSFVGTMFVPYIGYYLWGSFLFRYAKKPFSMRLIANLFVMNAVGIVLGNFWLVSRAGLKYENDMFLYYHLGLQVITLTTLVFLFFQFVQIPRQVKERFSTQYLKKFSSATLAIYILHPAVLLLSLKGWQILMNRQSLSWIELILFIPFVLGITYLVAGGMQKIKYLRVIV